MSKLSEWRFSLEVAWDDHWFRWQTVLTAVIYLGGLFFWLRRMIPIGLRDHLLVFHYNPYLGIDEVQPWTTMFFYIGASLLILMINFVVSFQLFRHDRIASRVILVASTLFTILLLIGAHFIASVNT